MSLTKERTSETLHAFCDSLTDRGFSLWFYDSKQSRTSKQVALACEFSVVCGFPAYFFKDAKTYKDVPIAVYGFETQRAMRAQLSSIGCGGHYKFIRIFQSGKDTTNYDDKSTRTRVPDPNSPTVFTTVPTKTKTKTTPSLSREKRPSREEEEEREKKRKIDTEMHSKEKGKEQRGENEDLCGICMVEKRNVVFLQCGHVIACEKCVKSLTSCPICTIVGGWRKLFFA